MARSNTLVFFVFAFGLMSSASMAKAPSPAQAPKPAAPKTSLTHESSGAAPPASAPSEHAKAPSPAGITQTPASGPSADGPASLFQLRSGTTATASLEMMAIFGAALVGGAAFFL